MVTIGLPIRNELQYVKKAINSLVKNTKYKSFELILVDDNSNKETNDYLRNLRFDFPAKLLINKRQCGFPHNCNLAMEHASPESEFTCIITSDLIFTPNWLEKMMFFMEKFNGLGAIGPRSSWCAGEQCMPEYKKIRMSMKEEQINKVAKDIYSKNKQKLKIADKNIMGFCMLLRRKAMNEIKELHYFDERFFPGSAEDIDICIRLRKAKTNYIIGVALDTYIHHFGNKSFGQEYKTPHLIWQKNERTLMDKHGKETWPKFTSIIMNVYNPVELVKKSIYGILETTVPPYELILIDNHSPDAKTRDFIRTINISNVKIVDAKKNIGSAEGLNLGLKNVQSDDYIVKFDDDTIPLIPKWNLLMQKVFEQKWSGILGLIGAEVPECICGQYELEKKHGVTLIRSKTGNIGSGCLMTRKHILKQVGGFEPSLPKNPYWGTDSNLCVKLRKKGILFGIIQEIKARHLAHCFNEGADPVYALWKYYVSARKTELKFSDFKNNKKEISEALNWKKEYKKYIKI